ncbi:MAG: glycosyltransferase family protein [Candidatus Thermoplasmatota archaeon]|nr:glycosyltransferase family protein [Candidatus Thermoplasmatota archaeon]
MNIIYAICSWGLGHATRSLPVIRRLIKEDHTLTIISHDRALTLLQNELKDAASFVDIPDYPLLVSENKQQFIAKSMVYWPLFIQRMESGLQRLIKLLKTQPCDRIISDGRYDMYSRSIPSYFISHQMRIMNPMRFELFERGSETFNLFFFKRFKEIIIPDYRTDGLSGDLSHNLKKIDEKNLHYVGVLSDFKKRNLKKDIDFFISLSGPEPQRSLLEQRILSQIDDLSGTIVMTLGKPETVEKITNDHVQTYTSLPTEQREQLLNKSKLVISRSGYSTISDLAIIGTKALMIPTPGQIEQEYLAEYHKEKNSCHTITQDALQLSRDVEIAKGSKGFIAKRTVDETVDHMLQIIGT